MKFPLLVIINGHAYQVGELRLRKDGTVVEISTCPDKPGGHFYTIRGEELALVNLVVSAAAYVAAIETDE